MGNSLAKYKKKVEALKPIVITRLNFFKSNDEKYLENIRKLTDEEAFFNLDEVSVFDLFLT